MFSHYRPVLAQIGALGILAGAIILLVQVSQDQGVGTIATSTVQTAAVTVAANDEEASATTTAPATATAHASTTASKKRSTTSAASGGQQVRRLSEPYTSASLSVSEMNAAARGAIVNILCMPRAGGSLHPVTGSGVIVDPRGVILTNAHVAQYVLLSESAMVDLNCVIRSGSPAIPRWRAEVLYIPPVWVEAHAKEINDQKPFGTGEHDYALLRITNSTDGASLPVAFPYLSLDTREGVSFQGDEVLVAGYPAEFLGNLAASYSFYPTTSVTSIRQLLTFTEKTIDIFSLGGVIEAQGGSSGGAVVNAWGKLVGIISTTSEGTSTADRDLHALTLSYIDKDISAQTTFGLAAILGGDPVAEAADFNSTTLPALLRLYINTLEGPSR